MKLFVPPLEIAEDEGFTPEKDIFNRKPFGESLLDLIRNTDDELVLALDAPWGEGETTFIKMWCGLLSQKNIPYIYFDAFENDYQTDPFLAIAREIHALIEKTETETETETDVQKQFEEKALSALKVIGRAGLRIGVKTLTAGLLDETVFDDNGTIKDASKEASDFIDSYFEKQLSQADQDKTALSSFREFLSQLPEKMDGENKIVFIIDELDRCRPNFALSILERIKHLFSTPNIVFLLAINRIQLEESVRCEYGKNVNTVQYLQKFVSIWTTLPKNIENHSTTSSRYFYHCLKETDYHAQGEYASGLEPIEELISHYDLSLREIEKSITNFAIIHNTSRTEPHPAWSIIAIFISITKAIKPGIYQKIANNLNP